MSMTEELPAHLQGNGRPTQEELTLTDLKVVGHIPAELDERCLHITIAIPLGLTILETNSVNHSVTEERMITHAG